MLSEKSDGKMMKFMKMKSCEDYSYTIFIAGDEVRAQQICEEFCLQGFCVTCEPTTYIYTMGKESGVRVGVINYARFPRSKDDVMLKVFELADKLLIGLNQGSYSVVGGGESFFKSRRDCDLKD